MPSTRTDRLRGLTTSIAVKAPVLVASTGNISTSSTQVIDGIAVSTGDRVLLWNQDTGTENGIWIVGSGTWTRAADFDGALDVTRGTVVYVSTGTAYGNLWFGVTSTGGNLPGTDSITFAQTAGLTEVSQLNGALDTNDNAINESESTAIASASTCNPWANSGNTIHITGGVSISSFSTASRIGARRNLVFDSTLVILASGNLVLPSSTDITTAAGDQATIYADSTILHRLTFAPKDGRPVQQAAFIDSIAAATAVASTLSSFGLTTISSGSATAIAFEVSYPRVGIEKVINIDTSASEASMGSSATAIVFASTVAVAAASTGFFSRANLAGTVIKMVGISTSQWLITGSTTSLTIG